MKIVADKPTEEENKTKFEQARPIRLTCGDVPGREQRVRMNEDEAKTLHRQLEAILYPGRF